MEAIVERAEREATRGLHREAGALRADAAFGAEVDAGVGAKATLMMTQAAAADAKQAIDVFADAEFSEHVDLTRAVGVAVLERLRTLAAADKHLQISDARNTLLMFEQRWGDWRRAHPSARERIAQLEREQANRRVRIEQAAQFALRLCGVGRPAPPPPQLRSVPDVIEQSRLRVGPAFDLLNRRPGDVRR